MDCLNWGWFSQRDKKILAAKVAKVRLAREEPEAIGLLIRFSQSLVVSWEALLGELGASHGARRGSKLFSDLQAPAGTEFRFLDAKPR